MSETLTRDERREKAREWAKNLPSDRPMGKTGVFYREGMDIIYIYSDGHDECVTPREVPEMIGCAVTGKKVWSRETRLVFCESRNREIRVSHKGMNAFGGCIDAMHWNESTGNEYPCKTLRAWVTIDNDGCSYTKAYARKYLRRCSKTGSLMHKSRMEHFRGELVSRNWVRSEFQRLVIQRHRHREPFITPESPFYCGIELELEAPNSPHRALDVAHKINEESSDYSFMKRDGSLGEFGIEWVTHPVTWEDVRSRVRNVLPEIGRLGARSHEPGTCGLHVHLPKENLSILTISRMVMLWNSSGLVLSALCGRKPNRYCTRAQINRHAFNGGPDAQYHHTSLNTENPATVEFRSFRGTLNQHTFMARVGLCFAVAQYCKQCGNKPNWDDFAMWFLKSHYERKMFPEAMDLVIEEGLKRKSRQEPDGRRVYFHLFGKEFHDAAKAWMEKKSKKQ